MGRHSTGAQTIGQALRIELSYLLKQGYIKKGYGYTGLMSWNNGSNISVKTLYTDKEKYVQLTYSNKSNHFDYKIELITIPSNLGKGELLYFVCPVTYKPCRILYLAYNSEIFKSRSAYKNRIYYDQQIDSKLNRHINRYFELEKRLEKHTTKIKKTHYKGNKTRTLKKFERLQTSIEKEDFLRWTIVPKCLKGIADCIYDFYE